MAVLIIFSKETGTFMVGVAFLALMAAWLQKDRDARVVKEAALFFAGMVVAMALYVWLSCALIPEEVRALRAQSAGVGRYLDYGVTWDLISHNAAGYWTWMSDTAACAFSSVSGVL